MPKKFVSHSHQDNHLVVPFVEDLRNAGLDVWVDLEQIEHDSFHQRMDEGLALSDGIVLIQTPNLLPMRSTVVGMEIYAELAKKLRGVLRDIISFIMVPCDANEVPDIWRALHHYDAVRDGYAHALAGLLRALGVSGGPTTISPILAKLLPGSGQVPPPPALRPLPTPPLSLPPQKLPPSIAHLGFIGQVCALQGRPVALILPPMCQVAAGDFWMGSQNDPQAFHNELWHLVTSAAYDIGRYPVTVAEYACAVRADMVSEPPKNGISWADQLQHLDHPVVNVTWLEAMQYAEWLAAVTGESWRLPTEAEWEKAARWDAARQVAWIYPWGDDFDANRANTDNRVKTTTAVGTYASKGDASPTGCHDMAGNVWEWTSSIYDKSAYQPDRTRENSSDSTSIRLLRGGSWNYTSWYARAANRYRSYVDYFDFSCGFRLVRSVISDSH